jgi:hypothetical protein
MARIKEDLMDARAQGFAFAVANIRKGETAEHASGTQADRLFRSQGVAGMRMAREFSDGVEAVRTLPQSVINAIHSNSFTAIDWEWSQGDIPAWLFPLIKDGGVLTGLIDG